VWRAFHDAAPLHADDPEFLFTYVDVTRASLAYVALDRLCHWHYLCVVVTHLGMRG
jgi:hypothetical protein